jgi:hypothetical protein
MYHIHPLYSTGSTRLHFVLVVGSEQSVVLLVVRVGVLCAGTSTCTNLVDDVPCVQ